MEYEERLLNAINALKVVPFGSIWIINDAVWKRVIADYVVKRRHHPGIAISRRERFDRLTDIVPCMIGTSQKSSSGTGFRVENVMPHSNKKHTYFKVVRPCHLHGDASPELAVKNFCGNYEFIRRSRGKTLLDDGEKAGLVKFLTRKGLRF